MTAVDIRGLVIPWDVLPRGFDCLVEWMREHHPDRVVALSVERRTQIHLRHPRAAA